ncbi:RagB/SusD family nutrient uptake outer membrane protein [Tenacibaculum sp. Ill]|uniref:RagB/SusD family nutrient uptake outer membrane protein n=1 Tax=Tenacibaculum sp. Ill TaxID=3445935 RepID=UPI003F7A3970
MKNIILKTILLCSVILFSNCELEDIPNPNAPTEESFSDGASQADVQLLAVGLEAVMRNDLEFHYNTVSLLAREYYDLSGTDPRYTGEILKGPLDNNGFLTTRSYAAWYRVVKSANVLITAVENSNAGFSDSVKNSYYGYAKTLKAYALLMVANRQYDNGIRIDVNDPDNLGPFIGYEESLIFIKDLLNEARSDLSNSPDEFDFPLSSGFDDLRKPDPDKPGEKLPLSPSDFTEFNRALVARVALYQGDNTSVLNFLNESFFDLNGGLFYGVTHVFGATGNDILNNQFHVLGQSGQEYVIHNSWINDAESGDNRVANKSFLLSTPAAFDGLSATHQIAIYKSNTAPVYLIRNEELILMYAEANIGTNNTEAINAIDIIRNAAGLPSYSGGTSDNELVEEVLKQRRYSLLGEGHRWVDLRRLNRLNATYVPLDRAGDNIINAFPTPFSENAN